MLTPNTDTRVAPRTRPGRIASLAAGLVTYGLFGASFGYFLLWFGGVDVPQLADHRSTSGIVGALVDIGLVLAFAVPHSVMPRPRVKRWLTRQVPATLERTLYVFVSSVTLALLTYAWQPVTTWTLWDVDGVGRMLLHAGYVAGVALIFWVSFLLGHLHVTGVEQAYAGSRGHGPRPTRIRKTSLYARVRHPMNTGLLMVCWLVPTMTGTRLAAAVALSGYILLGQHLEERDLRADSSYAQYAGAVPALLPRPRRRATPSAPPEGAR